MADLLYLAVVFFVIALILGILGVRGAGISMDIAKWPLFLVLRRKMHRCINEK